MHAASPHTPRLSVIIPAYNAAHYLQRTLLALAESTFSHFETIVVDDGSTDGTAALAESLGVPIFRNDGERGPGSARNFGARHAVGEILIFLDADCMPHPGTLQRIDQAFDERPEIAALFGSYDDDPADRSLVSSFKNLMHHYMHHQGSANASTFWTGCGAIRAAVFREMGDFRPTTITCVEDIEYGHRLRDAGHLIWLRPDIQVKHLKRWTLPGLIRTDMLVRGIPWTVMMLCRGRPDSDLNLGRTQKTAAAFACLLLPGVALTAWGAAAGVGAAVGFGLLILAVSVGSVVMLNLGFYRFLARTRGVAFAIAALPLHLLYYHYSVVSFVVGLVVFLFYRS